MSHAAKTLLGCGKNDSNFCPIVAAPYPVHKCEAAYLRAAISNKENEARHASFEEISDSQRCPASGSGAQSLSGTPANAGMAAMVARILSPGTSS